MISGRVPWGRNGGYHRQLPGEGYRCTGPALVPGCCGMSSVSRSHRAGLLASPGLPPCNSKGFVFITSWGHVQRTASMGPRVRSRDPSVDPVRENLGGMGSLRAWLVCKLILAGGSRACRGLVACLSSCDKGLFTQLHFVWFMTSQVALSRRGTSLREWEVVVNNMSDHPVAACSVGFPVCAQCGLG